MRIDLCVGGDLGAWVASQFASMSQIHRVISKDHTAYLGQRCLPHHDLNDVGPFNEEVEVAVLVHYPVLLKAKTIARYKKVYNCHPGYLPFGRGFYPVPWAILDGTPAGATVHEIDSERIDAGPVVYQEQVQYTEADTALSLHSRVREAEKRLVLKLLNALSTETLPVARAPSSARGTYHSRADFESARQMGSSWEGLSAHTLGKYIRAFTFPPFPGLVLRMGDKDYEVKVASMNDPALT